LVRRRTLAIVLGIALALPAVLVQLSGAGAWWAEGLSLVLGATGLALLWSGVSGGKPDWVE
jgi:hypothetical protein